MEKTHLSFETEHMYESADQSADALQMNRRNALKLVVSILAVQGRASDAEAGRTHPKLPEVTDKTWNEVVEKNPKPVIVMFSADWCGYCKDMEKVLVELQREFDGKIDIVKMDSGHTRKDVQYREKSDPGNIPYCVFFSYGKALYVSTGRQSKEYIRQGILNTMQRHMEKNLQQKE